MNREELKDRASKLDERIPALWDRYPLVTLAVFLLGAVFGALLVFVVGMI